MSWKKKAAWALATAGVVSICLISLITYLASNSPLLAQKSTASNQEVNNTVGNGQSKIEHIKVLNKDGSYIETWRNLATGEERVDTVDAANHLQNRTIVTENGSRIYVISNVEGKLVGETWKLPEAIANENQKIYKLSLIESKKTQY
jgi:hypothetical protein